MGGGLVATPLYALHNMNKIKKIWNDPVWSKVISAIILLTLSYFVGIISWIWYLIKYFFNLLTDQINIPIWIFLSLVFFVFISLLLFLKNVFKKDDLETIKIQDYYEDIIFSIKWRWSYASNNEIVRLNAFCPACDYQLYPYKASSFEIIEDIGFKCEDCGKDFGVFNHNYSVLEDKVIRKIHQYIRSDEYKTRIK
jgi:hypothetical protein